MKLFLIPTPIAENAWHTISPEVINRVHLLGVFIVERAKTARHFVKDIKHPRPIQELIFTELSDNSDAKAASETFMNALKSGQDIGLLSEAGCPGVADPGAAIVALAHREGVQVVPLTGPSSILLSLMASGLNGQSFAFQGYLSPKRPELARDLRRLEQSVWQQNQTQIFIETPYRSQMVLEVALESLRPDTMFVVAQDITGNQELIKGQTIKQWKKSPLPALQKLPAVFLIGK